MPAPVPKRDTVADPGVPYLLPRGRVTVAHVLYMDLVAYSQSNTERQAALVCELLEVVRGVPEFQAARNTNRVIPLDSGDGLALVFLEDPTAPVRCAIGISQAIRSHPDLRVRMGINTGPVQIRSGISHRRNAFGRGINHAQRAMDRGDAGHILITAETVSILQDLEGWRDYLHDIGEYEVKHRVRLHLYNCYTDTLGNSTTPARAQREKSAAQSRTVAAQEPGLIGAILHAGPPPVSALVPVTPLAAGTRLGPYEIVAALGAGGMGKVYRARDTRLGRHVALKVLPAEVADDPARRGRFEFEARAVAALNHPNIVAVYDVGNENGVSFIVTELVEGESLRGAKFPLSKTLDVAVQMAGGLAAAHAAGIAHRDLKPDNILLTRDGRVKILDFGLAKATIARVSVASETLTMRTEPGVVIGTVGYMSPEQVRGQASDHRSDIFSFGLLLYELLAGRRAFHAETPMETNTAVLMGDPPDLPESVPSELRQIVGHCLEKDPANRFQSARDLCFALSLLAEGGRHNAPAPAQAQQWPGLTLIRRSLAKAPHDRRQSDRRQSDRDLAGELRRIAEAGSQAVAPGTAGYRHSRERLVRVVAAGLGLVVVGALAVAVRHVRESPPPQQVVRLRLDMPADSQPLTLLDQPLFSPDGSRIVFPGRSGNKRQLWMRTLDSTVLRPLPGTEGSHSPVFSPDSRSLAVVTGANLQRLDLATGAIQPLTQLHGAVTSWSHEGVILAAEDHVIKRLAASGGTLQPVTELDGSRGEFTHAFARFLPDGRHFLFHSRSTSNKWEDAAVYVGTINNLKFRKRLLQGTGPAAYAAPGWLLFTRDEVLLAQPFDAGKLELSSEPVPVARPIGGASVAGLPPYAYSVSETGSLAWLAGSSSTVTQLTWFDRTGKTLEIVGQPGEISNPVLSQDGKRLLATIRDPVTKTRDIWILDLTRGTNSRFTFGPAENHSPVWSFDGAYVVFSSSRKGKKDIYRKRADGVGGEEELLASNVDKSVDSLSPDGKYVLYNQIETAKPFSIWVLPLGAPPGPDRKPVPIVEGPGSAIYSQFSPNGRWIAYAYTPGESGPYQVIVQSAPSFGGPTGRWHVAGGSMPQWRRDGKELFFIRRNELMAAPVKSDGTTFEYGAPEMLFKIRRGVSLRNLFTPSADGQRFLFAWPNETDENAQIYVILDWPALLKKP